MSTSPTHRAIETVWRVESAKLIAAGARITRDIGIAEEIAQDALLVALERWPEAGVPDNPAAWLMSAVKHRAIDYVRRSVRVEHKHLEIAHDVERARDDVVSAIEEAIDDDIGDDLLRLVFTTCHTALSLDVRVALTLRLLGGLTTQEIARAFLTSEATIAQRIVRAKRTLSESGVPFEVPRGEERFARLAAVLEVLYLIFNEGYSATMGDEWIRPELCNEALRLGRIVAQLMPDEREVHGLVALMELQASRLRTRVDANGEPILLLDQNRARWDRLHIARGLHALSRAQAGDTAPGTYTLQAAIAACHAVARTPEETDWVRIATLYALLVQQMPSPIVELNRAVAVSMAFGPAEGLTIVDALAEAGHLASYHLLPSVRGDLLSKLGRKAEARQEFERAARMTQNAREQSFLRGRAAALMD